MAVGTVATALATTFIGIVRLSSNLRLTRALRLFPAVALIITLHLVLVGCVSTVDFGRALSSLPMLGICLAGGGALADILVDLETSRFESLMRRFFLGLLILGMAAPISVLQPFHGSFEKPVFPFTEPSHFALAITPFLIFSCVSSSPKKRMIYLGTALLEALLLQNLTFLVGCFFAASITLRRRHMVMFVFVLVPVLLALDLSYYLDRIDFSGEVQNLSSLVYLQGWQMIEESLTVTHGLGRGFQQLGLNGTAVSAADLIRAITGGELNLLDGGFNLSKLVCEFGILGALLSAWYVFVGLRAFRTLRSVVAGRQTVSGIQIFCASVILAYLLEIFLRGAGYFTPTGLLLITALMLKERKTSSFMAGLLSNRRVLQNEINS
jgi:hypothetical protein